MTRVLVLLALLLVVYCNAARGLDAGTPEPEPTPTPTVGTCHGDCNADGEITVDDLIRLVLGIIGMPTECAIDPYPRDDVTAVILAVTSAIEGCQGYHYRLVPPSSISYSSAESGGAVVEEPLSGTFVAVPIDTTFHVFFYFAVRDLDFRSPSFRVVGRPGGTILTLSLGGIEVRPDLFVSIGGLDSLQLLGIGTHAEISCDLSQLPPCPFPPIFHGLPACVALTGEPARDCSNIADGSVPGYSLKLFAVTE